MAWGVLLESVFGEAGVLLITCIVLTVAALSTLPLVGLEVPQRRTDDFAAELRRETHFARVRRGRGVREALGDVWMVGSTVVRQRWT